MDDALKMFRPKNIDQAVEMLGPKFPSTEQISQMRDILKANPELASKMRRVKRIDDAIKMLGSKDIVGIKSQAANTMSEMMNALTPEARKEVLSKPAVAANIEKFIARTKPVAEAIQTQEQRVPGLGRIIGPAIGLAQGGLAAQDIMDKVKAGQSVKEAISNPEVVKNAARGALGYMGAGVGANLGSLVPGGVAAKLGGELAGAVAGGYAGSKLADLLTGNPAIDKIIRAQYERARNERMAKTKPTAASSVQLRSGE